MTDKVTSSDPSNSAPRTASMRELICVNQGLLSEYIFIASSYHRELRKSLERFYAGDGSPQLHDSLVSIYDEMLDFLNVSLEEAVYSNFSALTDSLSYISPQKPRIGLVAPLDSECTTLIDLFRYPDVSENYRGRDYEAASASSAFPAIKSNDGKRHFICNDIPKALKDGEYFNNRLHDDARERCIVNDIDSMQDPEWCKLWKDDSAPETCFKSNLVIPITLTNNKISQTLDDELPSKAIHGMQFTEIKNRILAYLWIDHTKPHYFADSYCVDAGYACADLISLYLIVRYQFTKYSSTWEKATAISQSEI